MTRHLALLLLALAQTAAAQSEPPYDAPLAQQRPPDTARTPAHIRLARREPVACGPLATRAEAMLAVMGKTGSLNLEEFGALRAFCASEEAARHPVLVAMSLAVAMEHELALDEATPARREAVLDVLLSPAIPQPTCLRPSTVAGVRFRVLAETCNDLINRQVSPKAWAQSPARLYLLMLHRTGEDITADSRTALRRELGDPEEIEPPGLLQPRPAP
jgi:hypothetical protein